MRWVPRSPFGAGAPWRRCCRRISERNKRVQLRAKVAHIVNRHVKAPRAQSIGKAKLARRHGGHSAASPDGLEAPCLACTKGKHCAHTCGVRGKAAEAAAAAAKAEAEAALAAAAANA